MTRLLKKSGPTWLPEYLLPAHELCFLHHDILVELLRSGEETGAFQHEIELRDDHDQSLFADSEDIFEWLERTRRAAERAELLRRIVFPALLSDLLHFVYQALDSSRLAKLSVCYALIRKPIQENLFLLETIAADVTEFSQHLTVDPQKLRAQKVGGLAAHERRVAAVLAAMDEKDRFDAAYLARLRYDRSADDGFDGFCNKAIHLFTDHPAIRTAPLNVNFIFSGADERLTQWYHLYSRLPFLLDYTRQVVEHICAQFCVTDRVYRADVERRMMAATLLWAPAIDSDFRHPAIERYVAVTERRLTRECVAAGHRAPSRVDLVRMKDTGALPGESRLRVHTRNARYAALALAGRARRGIRRHAAHFAKR